MYGSTPAGRVRCRRQTDCAVYDKSLTPTPDTLAKWLKQLHDFGPIRATGTPQARAFEEWLATQVTRSASRSNATSTRLDELGVRPR
jgi:hypothetical protein